MSTETESWTEICDLAVSLAREAGAELMVRFGQTRLVELKGDLDPVTDADQAAETLIREGIQTQYPNHSILGEEQAEKFIPGAIQWIIDPLDGTVNYAHGFPQFAVSIGVADGTGTQVGVVYDPTRDECFIARRGQFACLNGDPIQVSDTRELQRSLLGTGFPYDRHLKADNNHREFEALNLRTQGVRRAGAAALDLAYVACSRLDGFWEQDLSPWDVAAGALLIAEAGGQLSTYDGETYDGVGDQIVGSNGHLHKAILTELNRVRRSDL